MYDKPNDASVENSKEVSPEKDPNEKVLEEVTTVNTKFENYNLVEENPEKGVTVKTTHLQYKCDECSYLNISEKGLKQHKKMKHKIPQTDGANDNDLKEDEVPDISHLVVLKNWEKENYTNVHLLHEVLLEPPAKVLCRVKGIGVYAFTCPQGTYCYKFDDGDIMDC